MDVIINNKIYKVNNKNLINLFKDFIKIESIKDLNKNNFVLYDYNLICYIVKELIINKKVENIFLTESSKNYLKKFDMLKNDSIEKLYYNFEI